MNQASDVVGCFDTDISASYSNIKICMLMDVVSNCSKMSRDMTESLKCTECKGGFLLNQLNQCEPIPSCNALGVENDVVTGV